MYLEIEESCFKAELELLDRYLKSAAELLRLSLLSIGVIGFVYKEDLFAIATGGTTWPRLLVLGGVVAFALSAALATFYRYLVTEGFRYYTRGLRFHLKPGKDGKPALEKRERRLYWCIRLKVASAAAVGESHAPPRSSR